ncbi:MAG TPA: hypothetical protein VJU82_14395 [Acidobacteriaceae bacterium]|nr:hypothetical protein [Acidobacteriaceae bacterium]
MAGGEVMQTTQPMPPRDRWAVALLALGGIALPVIGWFIGQLLLWTSGRWSIRQKVLATLLVPGGFLPALLLLTGVIGSYSESCLARMDGSHQVCTGGHGVAYTAMGWVVFLLLLAAPLWTVIMLGRSPRHAPEVATRVS